MGGVIPSARGAFAQRRAVAGVEPAVLLEVRMQGQSEPLSGKHTIAVRPEYVRLNEVSDEQTGLVGTVDFVRLLGTSIETELSVGDRTFVQTMVSDRAPRFKVGDRAEIGFGLDHAWVIPS